MTRKRIALPLLIVFLLMTLLPIGAEANEMALTIHKIDADTGSSLENAHFAMWFKYPLAATTQPDFEGMTDASGKNPVEQCGLR